MRLLFFIGMFFLSFIQLIGQEKKFQFYRYDDETKLYIKDFEQDKLESVLDSLQKVGYFTLTIDSIRGQTVYLNKGKLYQSIWVKNNELFEQKTAYFPTNNLDSILNKITTEYSQKGFPFAQIKIVPNGFEQNEPKVELVLDKGNQRQIDGVKLVGYEKLSKGYLKHGLNIKKGEIYNEKKLMNISALMKQTNYINEVQQPQTLFKKDSTILYLYPQKVSSNYFDGILGFGTDDNGDFRLNGNVQLSLNNVFNNFEEIRLNWIGTANKNTSLSIGVKVPYLFSSAMVRKQISNYFKKNLFFVRLIFQNECFNN